ncbi:DNA-binding protein [Luteimicrobium sp. DT211]|uniref:DNA-binding protein n=1 Tax=Luteimicrobium sp. DT211 TaxID=3393412 RepID=UPI003CE75224
MDVKTRVYEAADELLAETGKRPSVALVRERARCSMADASRYVREWWTKAQEKAAGEQPVPGLPSPVAEAAQRSTLALWRAAIAAAREEHASASAAAQASVVEAQEAADALAAQVDEAETARDQALAQLEEHRARTTTQLEALAAERDRLSGEVERERTARVDADQRAAAAQQEAATANGVVAGLREALDALKTPPSPTKP